MNDFVDQYLGFNSDERVTSVLIRYGSGSDVDLSHYIDDVSFNVAPPEINAVDEPIILWLMAFGLSLLGFSKRYQFV
jgi:hypothetical protein